MRTSGGRITGRVSGVAAAWLCVLAGSAAAQGYTVESVETEPIAFGRDGPADSVVLIQSPRRAAAESVSRVVELPFRFPFFGEPVTSLRISGDGLVVPGGGDLPPSRVPEVFPDGSARATGFIAPLWRRQDLLLDPEHTVTVFAFTEGEAPSRRFVVAWWLGGGGRERVQLHLHERHGEITFTYEKTGAARTGTHAYDPGPRFVRGLAEAGGDREMVPPEDAVGRGWPSGGSVRFSPRAPLFHAEDGGREFLPVRWLDVRKEATVPQGSTRRATYLAKGRHPFHVRDRALFTYRGVGNWRKKPPEVKERLLAEDRATFGGDEGDARRWVRQVLDGKMIFLPAAPGAPPLRVWFRIVEYYSLDDRGNTLTDHHTWNLRWMLSNAFRDLERKEPIDAYWAWKAMARGRLTVGKLFPRKETDDAGRQFSSGRKNEYLLWSGRLRRGTRGALAPYAAPEDGWVTFALREEDMQQTQHVERDDLRFVPDPNYVDGHYEYTVEAADNPYGWVTGRAVPAPPIRDEGFDEDPGREAVEVTPR